MGMYKYNFTLSKNIIVYYVFIRFEKDELLANCCKNCSQDCDFYKQNNSDLCALYSADISSQLWLEGLNIYNIYEGTEV